MNRLNAFSRTNHVQNVILEDEFNEFENMTRRDKQSIPQFER